jgi:hypothetical protein
MRARKMDLSGARIPVFGAAGQVMPVMGDGDHGFARRF